MTAVRLSGSRALRVLERNARVQRERWWIPILGMAEPFLFLFSIGVGVGELVGVVDGDGGTAVDYQTFVAPALLASSAMNTAVFGCCFDFFAKYKWVNTYDQMLATPIGTDDILRGETAWILLRVLVSAVAFTITMTAMGLVESWWGVLLPPTALLVAFAFSGAGFLAATYLRSWLDWDLVYLAVIPLFLFSASFFPLSQYPDAVAWIVRVTPLYHGVDLCRDLALGTIGWGAFVSIAYLTAMGTATTAAANHRLKPMLTP
ncbi:MAG: ABC transporter permease [Actinomycetota bacterium]